MSQEVFDIVSKGLLEQNAKSWDEAGICKLRDGRGRKCALGFLIPDEEYVSRMEIDIPFGDIASRYGVSPALLDSLRAVHDCSSPSLWRKRLERVADDFNLDKGVLNA